MKVINFFGAPSSGKSTAAAGLFYIMKKEKYNTELVTEFAKDLVYEDNRVALSEQNYVFANQEYRLCKLKGKVDYAITDSPIVLSNIYAKHYVKSFNSFCLDMFNSYENINIFIERNHEYSPVGRLHNEEEANNLAESIRKYLNYYRIDYHTFIAGDDTPNQIYKELKELELL